MGAALEYLLVELLDLELHEGYLQARKILSFGGGGGGEAKPEEAPRAWHFGKGGNEAARFRWGTAPERGGGVDYTACSAVSLPTGAAALAFDVLPRGAVQGRRRVGSIW